MLCHGVRKPTPRPRPRTTAPCALNARRGGAGRQLAAARPWSQPSRCRRGHPCWGTVRGRCAWSRNRIVTGGEHRTATTTADRPARSRRRVSRLCGTAQRHQEGLPEGPNAPAGFATGRLWLGRFACTSSDGAQQIMVSVSLKPKTVAKPQSGDHTRVGMVGAGDCVQYGCFSPSYGWSHTTPSRERHHHRVVRASSTAVARLPGWDQFLGLRRVRLRLPLGRSSTPPWPAGPGPGSGSVRHHGGGWPTRPAPPGRHHAAVPGGGTSTSIRGSLSWVRMASSAYTASSTRPARTSTGLAISSRYGGGAPSTRRARRALRPAPATALRPWPGGGSGAATASVTRWACVG